MKPNTAPRSERGKPRFILFGGFIGAGRTTLLAALGEYLKARGVKAGLITNDHGTELTDTTLLRARGFSTEEVLGGCFSCDFRLLSEAAARLQNSSQAEVFVAEPVGTCTEIVATLLQPLQAASGGRIAIAPLSIVVDPVRAARILGLESGSRFSEKIAYIFRKQLGEAEFIVINKSDTLTAEKTKKLRQALAQHNPGAKMFEVSGRTKTGLEEWFECLLSEEHSRRDPIQVDRSIASEGEALLGWLNCNVRISSIRYFEPSKILMDLAAYLQSILQQEGIEVAHLKMMLSPDENFGEFAALNLVRSNSAPELSGEISEPIQSGGLILNLRAEADPEVLHSAVNRALLALMEKSSELFSRMEHCEHFRPGKTKIAPGRAASVLQV